MSDPAEPRWWQRPGVRWAVWGTYTAAWTAALLTPQPVAIADAILPHEAVFPTSKALHVAAYAGLAALTGWLRLPSPVRRVMLLFLSCHALATEYLQNYVPSRTASWADVGIDHVGILLGLALSWKWWRG